ncbi:hypothetical protein Dimus_017502 [Dionaea muscipula]
MSKPFHVDILSDDEDNNSDGGKDVYSTPSMDRLKRPRLDPQSNPNFVIIEDDPTPQKPTTSTSTPLFVAETPMSDLSKSELRIIKCTSGLPNPHFGSSNSHSKSAGISGLICLGSDDDSDDGFSKVNSQDETAAGFDVENYTPLSERFIVSTHPYHDSCSVSLDHHDTHPLSPLNVQPYDENNHSHGEINRQEEETGIQMKKCRVKSKAPKKKNTNECLEKQKMTMAEKIRLREEKKHKKEQDKLHKAALRAEAAELKKLEKEMQKWEKGKFAVNSIVAQIDKKVVEMGSIGGNLLSRLAEKDIKYTITSNPVECSILWTMIVPEQISQISSGRAEIPYILLVYEAERFCKLAIDESLFNHVSAVRSHFPSYTICCITNRLMAYINKREQEKYKNPSAKSDWRRPPVEEVFATLSTHFEKVHSRQCVDEADFADHVVGLTISLAKCRFRRKMTRLSVNANGSFITKDCPHRNLILKSPWLKSLITIPKVQPRFAIAIGKKYPTMKSLLRVYMDPSKSVHEKEFLLKDLMIEGLYGIEDRRLGEVCSKRIYRVLMAQSGSMLTDDVEDGADYFIDADS